MIRVLLTIQYRNDFKLLGLVEKLPVCEIGIKNALNAGISESDVESSIKKGLEERIAELETESNEISKLMGEKGNDIVEIMKKELEGKKKLLEKLGEGGVDCYRMALPEYLESY